ncbi:hypothetical protein AUC70_15885 [Methyloceanibacter stevinii]|uniref:Uncharacterized protein n=1 Tax=Methyloceanibacter stevinii TaxID=1774970 RepID=A0A1E3VS48_9HYPH|nr:hypothetical protein [Methyloceanibacter stevinii]ODR96355.1 hypothetical protein AUC70_15885 [Methyloceanibacter stevinii]
MAERLPSLWLQAASGTPEEVAAVKDSYTGQYLKELLGGRGSVAKAPANAASGKAAKSPSKRSPRKRAEAAE